MPIAANPKIFAWDKNLSWPLTRHWLYLLALFGNGAEGLWVYSPFQETDCPIRNYFPASSACFRWHDTPGCEHFLSKDPEKVGETGSAIWPDWGVDPWRSLDFAKIKQSRRRDGAVATI